MSNNFTIYIVITFLFAAVFGCAVAAVEIFNFDVDQHAAMDCCAFKQAGFSNDEAHNPPIIISREDLTGLFLLISFAVVAFVIDRKDLFAKHFYYFKTRDRYGGFKFNYYLSRLFSLGILHPKIY